MSLLLSCQSLNKSFGRRLLFQGLSLSIFEKDKVGLIGLNGSGKSTLLKILAGLETADSGTVSPRKGLAIGYVPQECLFPPKEPKTILLDILDQKSRLEEHEKEPIVEFWLSKLGFKNDQRLASELSGGWKKRLALGAELVLSPELLLLDEPTNHLDLEGILWIEQFLQREAPPYLLVSHDRYFLQNATNRIIEIDQVYPKGIFAIDGSYDEFLSQKETFLQGQLEQERSLRSKAQKETDWLRQGAKARTTKAQARIDQAHEILEEHAQVVQRNKKTVTKIDFAASERETRKLLTAKNLSKSIGERPLFRRLDLTLSPGSRVGLMGPNGAGKTTLLKILFGELHPDQGTIKKADELKIVYFDQHRAQLPLNVTLKQALSPDGDYVLFRGQPIHVNGWCKRFLFSPDHLEMPIGLLSGGERARISVARLILQPADLLLLDEPTNDLDIPTLEALEESIVEFPGAVVLITHDRCMLDRICTSLLALGDVDHPSFYADYRQWEAAQKPAPKITSTSKEKPAESTKSKLSYLEKKEYESIEGKIEELEKQIQTLNHQLETPNLTTEAISEICHTIGLAETQLERLFLRWHALEEKNSK